VLVFIPQVDSIRYVLFAGHPGLFDRPPPGHGNGSDRLITVKNFLDAADAGKALGLFVRSILGGPE
jgi:hypothetical protein